jgi:catechol 2,3-dioxygenase-like lactoylglutathione lyase family enzyme
MDITMNAVSRHVADLDRSVRFYRDVLGLPIEVHDDWAGCMIGPVEFVLELPHDDRGVVSGTCEVEFKVPDLAGSADELCSAGFEVDGIHHGDERANYFSVKDPDEYLVWFTD